MALSAHRQKAEPCCSERCGSPAPEVGLSCTAANVLTDTSVAGPEAWGARPVPHFSDILLWAWAPRWAQSSQPGLTPAPRGVPTQSWARRSRGPGEPGGSMVPGWPAGFDIILPRKMRKTKQSRWEEGRCGLWPVLTLGLALCLLVPGAGGMAADSRLSWSCEPGELRCTWSGQVRPGSSPGAAAPL